MAINAFVGHSFLSEDSEVVGNFLSFFDHVSGLGLDFAWEHAEEAEPKELSIKVMEKMEGKNLFIGICTSRQKSIEIDELKPFPLYRKKHWANKTAFATKTSDWILQEIGFAYGRRMKIMILMESGIKMSGGIQGDIEYISFDRKSPQQSFNKILEMIRSLTILPDSKKITETMESEGSPQQKDLVPEEELKEKKPVSAWTINDYEQNVFYSIAREAVAEEAEINANFIKSKFASNPDKLVEWEVRCLFLKMYFKKENHLDKLLEIKQKYPENSKVLAFIAKTYELYKEYDCAANYYQQSAMKAGDKKDGIIRLSKASINLAKSGDKIKANQLKKQCILLARELGNDISFMYELLADFANEMGDVDEYKMFTEAYLELSPEDHSRRFTLAFKYSKNPEDNLALYHYRILTERNPNPTNWNNFGVALSEVKLPVLSVYAYKEAEKMGETLAMSNLANKLISSGFVDEAQKLVEKATSAKDYDGNIGGAITRIRSIKEEEEKEQSKLIENFKKIRQFYIGYSKAYLKKDLESISLDWKDSKSTFEITINRGIFEAIGVCEKPKSLVARWLAPTLADKKEESNKEYVKYVGTVNGYSVKFKYWVSEGELPKTETSTPRGSGIMIIDDAIQKISIYEFGLKDKENFSEFIPVIIAKN